MKLLLLIILIFLIISGVYIYLNNPNSDKISNNNTMNIEKVYKNLESSKVFYKQIELKNLFKKYPKKVGGLNFGYICPGAMKTISFLNKETRNSNNNKLKQIVTQIRLLTDFQFFIEIMVIYKDYIDENIYREVKRILKNKSCAMSKIITQEITRLFGELPKKLKQNLPDDFYHIRHNTLICSNNKELANERITLLQSIYGSVENFNNNSYSKCLGKRNGVSGCRDCCNHYFSNNYSSCVNSCMDF